MAQDSASVVPFDFEDFEIRVVMIDEEPWWVAPDVCRVLGIADTWKAVNRLDEADTTKASISVTGQDRETSLVNESGLYELIIRSNKPDARRFRRWVTSEVLPSIRKTGQYGAAPVEKTKLEIARDLVAALEAAERAEKALAVATPKAIEHDAFMDSDGLASLADTAQAFGIGRNKFIDRLRTLGYLISKAASQRGGVRPYQRHCAPDNPVPLFAVKMEMTAAGRLAVTYVTPHGVSSLYRALARRGTGRADWVLPGSVREIREALGWDA